MNSLFHSLVVDLSSFYLAQAYNRNLNKTLKKAAWLLNEENALFISQKTKNQSLTWDQKHIWSKNNSLDTTCFVKIKRIYIEAMRYYSIEFITFFMA